MQGECYTHIIHIHIILGVETPNTTGLFTRYKYSFKIYILVYNSLVFTLYKDK